MAAWLLGLLGEFSICSAHVMGASSASNWYILLQGGAKTDSHVQAVPDSSPLINPDFSRIAADERRRGRYLGPYNTSCTKIYCDFTLAQVGMS